MHQWFAAGDRDHGGTALLDRPEALLGRQIPLENVGRILNLPQPAQARFNGTAAPA